ncbi:hypothetical protein [Pseudoluteimonas lycopersici]|uniref:hypothetical protein n=1 Tax=Pseudoluteimonas lycopersici TaxID=1324796 RepID=UPI001C8F9E37|nr:hypothetical protein [Lysobacter lycopersici]
MTSDNENELQPVANAGDDEEAANEFPELDALSIGNGCGRKWRKALSLEVLRNQVDTLAPKRHTQEDGFIGDQAHCQTNSDHNPWIDDDDGVGGVVTAFDITHDPRSGCDCEAIANSLQANKDSRIKYIIWNRRICCSYPIQGKGAWEWRAYTGRNPHTQHLHLSVLPNKGAYDNQTPWSVRVSG